MWNVLKVLDEMFGTVVITTYKKMIILHAITSWFLFNK